MRWQDVYRKRTGNGDAGEAVSEWRLWVCCDLWKKTGRQDNSDQWVYQGQKGCFLPGDWFQWEAEPGDPERQYHVCLYGSGDWDRVPGFQWGTGADLPDVEGWAGHTCDWWISVPGELLRRDFLTAGILYWSQVFEIQIDAHSVRILPFFHGEPGTGLPEPAVREKNRADEAPAVHICRVRQILPVFW